ncbi:MAG: DUF4912 domain-containing protein [Candidatus Omnitrophota bacterium]
MAILRKVGEKLKNIAARNKKRVGRAISRKKAKETVVREEKRETLGIHETAVVQAKFSTPEPGRPVRRAMEDLPAGYHENKIVLQVRDPWWLHSYWELTSDAIDALRRRLGESFRGSRMALRVYDVSYIIFDGKNANSYFDIEVNPQATSWYIDTKGPGRSWCVELGFRLANGDFIAIIRSNTVHTPIDGPSWITDEEWMIPDDVFARLYGMGFGLGQSSPVGKAWQERLKRELYSGALSSGASPVKKHLQQKGFWMVVNTELVVYGATEPDAKLTVQGKPVALRADGTFTLRFALPDGRQVIPVEAVSADSSQRRSVTPIVSRETR